MINEQFINRVIKILAEGMISEAKIDAGKSDEEKRLARLARRFGPVNPNQVKEKEAQRQGEHRGRHMLATKFDPKTRTHTPMTRKETRVNTRAGRRSTGSGGAAARPRSPSERAVDRKDNQNLDPNRLKGT